MPDSASIPTGLTTLSLEREESRGKLAPAHLSLWLGGVVATGKKRDFEEKKVGYWRGNSGFDEGVGSGCDLQERVEAGKSQSGQLLRGGA